MPYLKKALFFSVSAASNQLVVVQGSSRQQAEIVMWSTFWKPPSLSLNEMNELIKKKMNSTITGDVKYTLSRFIIEMFQFNTKWLFNMGCTLPSVLFARVMHSMLYSFSILCIIFSYLNFE